jgi:tetratricopeptide (TPR) repeat protein
MAYFDMKQFDEAAKNYEKAVKLDDRDYEVWGNLGDAYYWTKNRAKATHAYERAISLAKQKLQVNPRDATLLGYLAVYHAMLASKESASNYVTQALSLTQNDPELLFDAALVHYQLGQTNQALASLEKALKAGFSPTQLHDTPNFASLSTDPRFQKLLGSHLEQQRRVR